MGRFPHSGMPGAPTGPALRSTRTVSSVTSRSGCSIASRISPGDSKTSAGPSWTRNFGLAAEVFITAPCGARLPRRTASVRPRARGTAGFSRSRMTSSFQHAAPSSASPSVRPSTVGHERSRCASIFFRSAGRPPANQKSSIR